MASLSRGTEGACFSWQLCRQWALMGMQVCSGIKTNKQCLRSVGVLCLEQTTQDGSSGLWEFEWKAVAGEATEVDKRGSCVFAAFHTLCAWLQAIFAWLTYERLDSNCILKLFLSWLGRPILLIKKTFSSLGVLLSSTSTPMSLVTILHHRQAVVIRFHCLLPAIAWGGQISK